MTRSQQWTLDDLDAWYREHSGWLRKLAARRLGDTSLAEDVVHDAFIRAWIARDRLTSPEHVGPWLHRTTQNLCVDVHRRRSRQLTTSLAVPARDCDPADELESQLRWTELVECLRSLGERQRRALVLRAVEGMSYAQLASELGVTAVGARAVVNRARQTLRLKLVQAGHTVASLWPWLALKGRWAGAPRRSEGIGAALIATAGVITALVGESPVSDDAVPSRPPAIVAQATPRPKLATPPLTLATQPSTAPTTPHRMAAPQAIAPPASRPDRSTRTDVPAEQRTGVALSLGLRSRDTASDPSDALLELPLVVRSSSDLIGLLNLRLLSP